MLTLGIGLVASPAGAADFFVERVASGLSRPVFLTAPPGDTTRAFIVEQRAGTVARVRILDLETGALLPTPFLSISPVATAGEQGMLGLAFHPDYASNGYFFVSYTDASGTLRVERHEVSADPDQALPGSAHPILSIPQPQGNHNGGWLGFGREPYLYVSSGDGGGSDDDDAGHTLGTGNSQDIEDNLLGKMLRIDVNADDFPGDTSRNYAIPPGNPFVDLVGDDEIWCFGLRNPWRPSFDRKTGDLYIADVGQGAREEINFQPSWSQGGEDYGWRLREGTIATPTGGVGGPRPAGAIDPLYEYSHGGGPLQGNSVTGGYVYRGPVLPLRGQYFFADFINDRIWSLAWDGTWPEDLNGTNFTNFVDWTGTPEFDPAEGTLSNFTSFGEDAAGNLYILTLGGEVFRLTAIEKIPALPGVAAALAGALIALTGVAARWAVRTGL